MERIAMSEPAAPFDHTDEHWLAMAALDHYPIDDGLPKSTSVVYRIHQLGHAWEASKAVLERDREELEARLCPEDVGIDEYVYSLRRRLAQVEQERDEARTHEAVFRQQRDQFVSELIETRRQLPALRAALEKCIIPLEALRLLRETVGVPELAPDLQHAISAATDAARSVLIGGAPALTGEEAMSEPAPFDRAALGQKIQERNNLWEDSYIDSLDAWTQAEADLRAALLEIDRLTARWTHDR